MDEQEFRAKLCEWDEASKDERVKRWKQLVPATYNVTLPNLVWYYITEADDLFIKGHFIGVILLCAGIIELVLSDQIKVRKKLTKRKIERLGLQQMTNLSLELRVLNAKEAEQIQNLGKLRNALIHGKMGKLNEMAHKRYKDWGLNTSGLDAGLFLKPVWEGGIDQDALDHLRLTRDLTVKFYGTEDIPSR